MTNCLVALCVCVCTWCVAAFQKKVKLTQWKKKKEERKNRMTAHAFDLINKWCAFDAHYTYPRVSNFQIFTMNIKRTHNHSIEFFCSVKILCNLNMFLIFISLTVFLRLSLSLSSLSLSLAHKWVSQHFISHPKTT